MNRAIIAAALLLTALATFAGAAPAAPTAPPTVDWITRYTGLGNGNNQVTDMAVDAQGCSYVTGYSSGTWWDMATVKYSPSGRQLHAARYNAPTGGDDLPYGIALDARGDVYVVGYTDGNGQSNYDFITIQYDSTLVQRWVHTYAGQFNIGIDEAYDVVADDSGNAYVTGFSFEGGTGNDYVTIKYDVTGARRWVQRYNGPANSDDGAEAIALDADGNVLITGVSQRSTSGGNYDIATIKYDNAGVQQWARIFNGTANGNDGGIDVVVDAARNVYVAGYTTGIGTLFDMATLKYAGDGTPLWTRALDVSHGHDAALALTLDPGQTRLIVTGYVTGATTHADYATVSYDVSGTQQWARFYDGPVGGYDEGQAVVADAEGNAYVTGYSDGGTGLVNYDYATLKYDAAGTQQWEVRYNGTGDDIDVAACVALDAQGGVILGGWSTGTNAGLVDFTTIKYRQASPATVSSPYATPRLVWAAPMPNPFHDGTTFAYHMPGRGMVELSIWDASGRKVRTLVHGWAEAGDHQAILPGSDLAPGIYLYRLDTAAGAASGKIARR